MPILRTTLRGFGRVDPVKSDALIVDLDRVAVDNERHAFDKVSGNGQARQEDHKQKQNDGWLHA